MATPTHLSFPGSFLGSQLRSEAGGSPARNAWVGLVAFTGMIILSNFSVLFETDSPVLLLLPGAFYVYLTVQFSGDRSSYRTLGMNRSRAVRQQLRISLPLALLIVGIAVPWFGAPILLAIAVAFLLVLLDLGATIRAMGDRCETDVLVLSRAWAGPGRRGTLVRRLVRGPLLRWAFPLGTLTGLIFTWAGHASEQLMTTALLVTGVVLTYLLPAVTYVNATASAGTWQAFGLPRRAWTRASMIAVVVQQLVIWAVALLVPAGLAWFGIIDPVVPARLLAPVLGMVGLLTGLSAVSVAEAGFNGGHARNLIFSMSASTLIIGYASSRWQGAGIFLAVLGLLLLTTAVWTQVHFAQGSRGGGRATLDVRRYAR